MSKLARSLAITYYRTKFKLLSTVSKKKAAEIAFGLFCTPQFRYKMPLPKNFVEAEKLSFEIQGETVQGYRWNKGGSRKVLIAHGFNSSVAVFDRYIDPLLKKGYEIIAFDAPAHGRSTGTKINVVLYKEMIQRIHEKYGPLESIMAHSLGGLSAGLALEEIDHDASCRLVLIAPATESKTATEFFFSLVNLDKRVQEEFNDLIYSFQQKPVEWYSLHRAIPHLRASVRWYHDEMDDLTPWKDARVVMDENHPHVKFVVTRGLGHRRIHRDPAVSRSIIDFL